MSQAAGLQPAAPDTRASREAIRPFESAADLPRSGRLDELVFARMRGVGIRPTRTCSDEVFVRRVHLDTIGLLPPAAEVRQFLADRSPDKRAALVDRLLDRDEYADYWTMKWCDLLRVKSEFPINLWPNAVQAYHHWVRACLRSHMPYDRFVREMLTASGSNFRVPQVNFYRAVQSRQPDAIARAVALTFMGTRAEKWPTRRLSGMAAFFSQIGYKATGEWKEEIVLHDEALASSGPGRALASLAAYPDGTRARLLPGVDPRVLFARWLTGPGNPWFARNVVNRLWYWLLGRGIIHEPDDIRPDNPPQNPALLSYLEHELVTHAYDLKHVQRLILNSGAYQLSSIPRAAGPAAAAYFAAYPLRRLDAEVLADALNQITGATDGYSSATPEPFTFIPERQRAVLLADGSITSPFLEMFGRPARDTGLESERSTRATAAQRLELLNSSHVRGKIERGPALQTLLRFTRGQRAAVDAIYLTILSRFPTSDERQAVAAFAQSESVLPRDAASDLVWALINSAEFLYRH